MIVLINLLRRIVDKYDEKNGLRKRTITTCHSWNTRNRYKLPEWQTKKGEPLCPIYKNDRCCGSCDLAATCDHATQCNCFGFQLSVLGGTTESSHMRKCSPYYKYGRMKDDGTFDWDYYYLNEAIDKLVPGDYVIVSEYEELGESGNALKDKNFKVGKIVAKMNQHGYIKLNFNEDNDGEDFIINAYFKGLKFHSHNNYETAKIFT